MLISSANSLGIYPILEPENRGPKGVTHSVLNIYRIANVVLDYLLDHKMHHEWENLSHQKPALAPLHGKPDPREHHDCDVAFCHEKHPDGTHGKGKPDHLRLYPRSRVWKGSDPIHNGIEVYQPREAPR